MLRREQRERIGDWLIAAGAVDCLVKPVSETVLLEAISAALRPRGVADTKV